MREAAGSDRGQAGQPRTRRKAAKRKAAKRSTSARARASAAGPDAGPAAGPDAGSAPGPAAEAEARRLVGRGVAAPIGTTGAPAPTKRATPHQAGPDAAAALASLQGSPPGATPGGAALLDGLDPLDLVDVGLALSVQLAARAARVDPELPELVAASQLTKQERTILRSCNLEGWCRVGQSWLNTPNGTGAAIGAVLVLHLFQVYSVLKRTRPKDQDQDQHQARIHTDPPTADGLPPDASRTRTSRTG